MGSCNKTLVSSTNNLAGPLRVAFRERVDVRVATDSALTVRGWVACGTCVAVSKATEVLRPAGRLSATGGGATGFTGCSVSVLCDARWALREGARNALAGRRSAGLVGAGGKGMD